MRLIPLVSFALIFACDSDKGVTAFNSEPKASITSHSDGDTVLEGYITTFRGSASDANHSYEDLTATWFVGTEVLCEGVTPESDGSVECEGVLLPTDTEVTLEVKDSGNATGSASVNLTVTPTDAPEALILTPESNGVYYSDQLITFTGILSDGEDSADLLIGYWESSLDGVLLDVSVEPNSEGAIEGFGYLTEGEHAIQLHVEDTTEKTGSDSAIVDVGPPNSAPLCEITAPATNSAGPEGELVIFSGTVSDVDVPSSFLTVDWSSDKDGVLGSSSPNSSGEVSFPYDLLSVNTHVVSMTVTDEIGSECVADVIYSVGTPPILSVVTPVSNDIYDQGSAITFEATVSDNEDQPTELLLSWEVDGAVLSTAGADSTGTAIFDDSSLAAGSHTLTVTATDTDGLYASDVVSFSVNALPSAPTVSISPDPATTVSILTASASGSVDPEGAPVNYSFVWLQNGQSTTYASATVPDTATTKHETWTVRVTPDDGTSNGPFTETFITVQNTPPVVSTVSVSPSTPSSSDSLTCTYTIFDPDETPSVTVNWTNNTTGLTLGSVDTLVLSPSMVSVNDSITCSVTATDGDAANDSASATVVVGNTAPIMTTVVISPSNATNQDSLACLATATDADTDPVTYVYTWTNLSTGASLGSGDTLALDSSISSPIDEIECSVIASDPNGGSDSGSDSITLENSTPIISDVIITPDTGVTTSSSLVCSSTPSDDDNDALTTNYEWTNGGNVLGYSNSLTLSPGTVSPSDSITCTATTTDPYGAFASDNASVVLENTNPVVDSVTISPSTAVNGDTLTCLGTTSDPDGGTPSLSYSWTINGTPAGSTDTLVLSTAVYSDLVVCTATATDNDGGSSSDSASLTLDNTAPVVSTVVISPSSATNRDTLTCTASASDVDGETLAYTYTWTNSTTGMSLGSGDILDLDTSIASPEDEIVCDATASDPSGAMDSGSANLTLSNTTPSLSNVTITPDTGVTTSTTLTCAAATSDADDDALTTTYEWTNGGNVLGYSNSLTLSPGTVSPSDSITCTATTTDPYGAFASDNASVVLENTDPVVDSVTISPSTAVNGDTLTCLGTTSDPDGGTPNLSYSWTINGTPAGSTDTLVLSTAIYSDLVVCTATATDNDGGSSSDSASLTLDNTAPVVSSVVLSPSNPNSQTPLLTCTATGSDVDNDPVSFSYEWFVDTQIQTETSNMFSGPFIVGAVIACRATPTDGKDDGTPLDDTATIENTDPVVDNIGISPDTGVTTSTMLSCNVSASDVDGGTPTIAYDWTVNGNSVGSAMQLTLTPSMVSPSDSVTCNATVSDADGGSTTGTAVVTVENTVPVFTANASIIPGIGVVTGTVLSCSAVATDIDDGSATVSYAWTNGGNSVGSGQSLTVTSSNSDVGDTLTCEVTATDIDGGSATSSDSVNVENTLPTVTSAAITPNTGVTTSTELTCSAVSSDADGDTPTLSYTWMNLSQSSSLGTGATVTLSPSTNAPDDVIQCTITATDAENATADIDTTVTVENTEPVVSSVTLTPNSGVRHGDDVTCSATATDADETAVTLSYSWTINGNPSGVGATLTLANAVDDDVVECTATALDADGGTGLGTADLTVENTPPVATSVVLTPSNPSTQDTMTCTASGTDADGDSVSFTYQWLINNQSQTETSNMLSGPFIVGSLIACRATPTDGKDDGTPMEDSATVENTLPTVSSVTLSPSSVYTNDMVTATAVLDDVDGQTVTADYAWHVIDFASGSDSMVQSGSDNTLSGVTHFDRDDQVYVVVTPNDGVDNGSTETSASLTVMNTAPGAPVVSLSPDPAIAGQDDLVCWVDTPSTDVDGDAVVYTYEWTDTNGVQQTTTEVADLSDTFLASGTSEGVWTCEVIPYDGTDYGSTGSDSVTVEGGCWSLDFGQGDYVWSDSSGSIDTNATDFTYETWINWDGSASESWYPLAGRGWRTQENHFFLAIRGTASTNCPVPVGGIQFELSDNACVASPTLDANAWYHVAAVYSNGNMALYLNGELVSSPNSVSNSNLVGDPILEVGVDNHNDYYFSGMISYAHYASTALYSSDFIPNVPVVNQNTEILWTFKEGVGNITNDSSVNNNHGTVNGATWVNTCPEEDLDGDSVAAWEDCDDGDITVSDAGSGGSASCAATSCKTILDDGYSTGDGTYWIDPDGSGAFEAYCDMTTDGGGWTLVGNFIWPGNTSGVTGWTDTITIGTTTSNLNGSFKLSDVLINSLANTVYKVNGNASVGDGGAGPIDTTLYWSGACVYSSNTTSTGNCSQAFDDIDLINPRGYNSPCSWHYGLTSVMCDSSGITEMITSHDPNGVVVGAMDSSYHAFSGRTNEDPNIMIWAK